MLKKTNIIPFKGETIKKQNEPSTDIFAGATSSDISLPTKNFSQEKRKGFFGGGGALS